MWTPAQIRAALEPAAAERAVAYYGVTEPGNFEGANILRPSGAAARRPGTDPAGAAAGA